MSASHYIHNVLIVHELLDFIREHPELRFVQALWALQIVDNADRFYEPSEVTLRRLLHYKEGETERSLNAKLQETSKEDEEATEEEP